MKKNQENEKIIYDILCEYVQENNLDVGVKLRGGSNSTVSDIEITKEGFKFFIECKMKGAQSSQFVLLDNGIEFIESSDNKCGNEFSKEILEFVNKQYNTFKNVETAAIALDLPEKLSYKWIISTLNKKEVKFVACYDNKLYVARTEDIDKLFAVKGVFRRKRSGTGYLPKCRYTDYLESMPKDIKTFCTMERFPEFTYTKKPLGKKERYFLSKSDNTVCYYIAGENGVYIAKKRSKTTNPNVIFTLLLKKEFNDVESLYESLMDKKDV